MRDCLKEMLVKSKELMIQTDDKLKIALSKYPDNEEMNKMLEERNTLYKESYNEGHKAYKLVEDTYGGYDNQQFSDAGNNGDDNAGDDEDTDKG